VSSLHNCPDLADRLDIAAGCKRVQDGQRDHMKDESNEGRQRLPLCAITRGCSLNHSFLEQVGVGKAKWRDPETEKRGIRPAYRWTGPGKDGFEVVYGTAESKPNIITVREIWKQRHRYRAAPLLV
jgi:hypothetical protein